MPPDFVIPCGLTTLYSALLYLYKLSIMNNIVSEMKSATKKKKKKKNCSFMNMYLLMINPIIRILNANSEPVQICVIIVDSHEWQVRD